MPGLIEHTRTCSPMVALISLTRFMGNAAVLGVVGEALELLIDLCGLVDVGDCARLH